MSDKIKRNFIRKQYSKVAKKQKAGCCGSCCCGNNTEIDKISLQIGYSEKDLDDALQEANMGLGCGNPVATANLKEGEAVLDLGCGGGFDCFLARKKVGEKGYVIGVDMTPEMIDLARKNNEKLGYKNVEFRLGEIENLPVEDGIIDVIISNCVINLSTDKRQAFKEAYRVLKKRGRLCISDVAAVRELPGDIRNDFELLANCISGAAHFDKTEEMLKEAGFSDIILKQKEGSKEIIDSWVPGKNFADYVAIFMIEAKK